MRDCRNHKRGVSGEKYGHECNDMLLVDFEFSVGRPAPTVSCGKASRR